MRVKRAEAADGPKWNEYVDANDGACVYHRFEWAEVFERAYGSVSQGLIAIAGQRVVGVLPMIELNSPIFGRIFCGMPFFGHGGMLADDALVVEALASEAARRATMRGAKYIELRHLIDLELGWFERRDKTNMILELPQVSSELFKGLKKKRRDKLKAQIRRPEKAGHIVRDGRHDLLHPFWLVYSENLRDLGSPAHSEKLFAIILDVFGAAARTFVVFDDEDPIAGGIVVGGQGTLEIPCASSLRSHNATSPNMMLYARVLQFACDAGYQHFNFGRSTINAGTYRFKKQWGAEPAPLIYDIWQPLGSPSPELKPDNPKFQMAVKAWKRLPVGVARLVGPQLVRGIP